MEIHDIFKVGILAHNVGDNLANKIENIVIPRINKLNSIDGLVNTDYHQQEFLIKLEEIPELVEEIYKCRDHYNSFLQSPNIAHSQIINYWVQDYKQDLHHHHPRHNHGKNELSVVYWIRASEGAGKIKLFSPIHYNNFMYEGCRDKNSYNTGDVSITPTKGTILMFPGPIDHEVLKGKENCIRTTIAFNLDMPLEFFQKPPQNLKLT